MCLELVIQTWAVWPPSALLTPQELSKMQDEVLVFVPNNVKRRLSPLAKTVFCAVSQCVSMNDCIPVVFSSTHGELATSLAMIKLIEAGEDISPTAFSLSVHNAIAGLFSIVFGNTSEITVLAPGEDGIAPAFIDALGLLQEGAPEVLMVFYDEPLPDFYPSAQFQLSADSRCAVALKIARHGEGLAIQFTRGESCGSDGEQPIQLPLLIQFLSGADTQLQIKTPRQSWYWQKHVSSQVMCMQQQFSSID
ncbi:MAG: beta-ketoacyl synthase chain length factor [Methylococcaceae bacterium]